MNFWVKSACLVLINAISFYALKHYYETRQVRLISALLPATVQVGSVGQVYHYETKVTKHTVHFIYKRYYFGRMYEGSGVIVSPEGLIVTCAHILHGSRLMEYDLNRLDEVTSTATYTTKGKNLAYVVYADTNTDVALLQMINPDRSQFSYVKLVTSVALGQEAIGISYPKTYAKYVTHGVISNFGKKWIFTDAMMDHGSSGGGVFTMDGHLIGLFSMMFYPNMIETWQGYTGLVPFTSIQKALDKYGDL